MLPEDGSTEPPDQNESDSELTTESDVLSSGLTKKEKAKSGWFKRSFNPFRIATLRGLAVLLPPLLTIIFFVWAWNAIDRAILKPVEKLAQYALVLYLDESMDDTEVQAIIAGSPAPASHFKESNGERVFVDAKGTSFSKVQSSWVPTEVIALANSKPTETVLTSPNDFYERYVQLKFLKRHLIIPAFLALFLALMYLVGKLLAAGIGRIFYRYIEAIINRVPIIRNVYSSVKQVTDFVFSNEEDKQEVQYTRVVAVEYPRKGVWSIGFVTGEGMKEVRRAVGEPMLNILMPTSPMPATGFTIMVPKSETIDLDITLDQAIQFCVSCGVVVPENQVPKSIIDVELRRKLTGGRGSDATKQKDNDSLDT